jgi:hypothetical protein
MGRIMGPAADGAGDRARAQAAHTRRARLHDGPRRIHLHLKPPRLGRLALPVDSCGNLDFEQQRPTRVSESKRRCLLDWSVVDRRVHDGLRTVHLHLRAPRFDPRRPPRGFRPRGSVRNEPLKLLNRCEYKIRIPHFIYRCEMKRSSC